MEKAIMTAKQVLNFFPLICCLLVAPLTLAQEQGEPFLKRSVILGYILDQKLYTKII